MKYYAILLLGLTIGLLLAGCAHEAFYADHEHGIASRDAFDQQIVYKDYKHAGKPVDGADAIYTEHIMGKYLETFKQGFTKESIDITATGSSSSNGSSNNNGSSGSN